MDPNYAKAKFALESKSILKTKHRGCWYYTKYFFFFLSIIQFLIILGLVLFMLYGNAHVGTELRLSSVENRYKNLTLDYTWLNGNFSQLKSKLASMDKENQNCTKLLDSAMKQLVNRTTIKPPIMPDHQWPVRGAVPARFPPVDVCKQYQIALDRLNTSSFIETLQLKHERFILQTKYDRLKENCDQNIFTLTNKGNHTISEMTQLQRQKEDLETQINAWQIGCTDINKRFNAMLDDMKIHFTSNVNNEHYSSCWSLSNVINKNIDQTINRMRQDVNNVMLENSQMKADNARLSKDFQKCTQEKVVIISEKNSLSTEKGGLEKQLNEKKEELVKSYSKYMKKEEELETCRKMQVVQRPPYVGSPSRNKK